MELQLIHGKFSSTETLKIISEMIQVKIRFNEDKIKNNSNEEDIKMRENKILKLQQELFELRAYLNHHKKNLDLHASIKIN